MHEKYSNIILTQRVTLRATNTQTPIYTSLQNYDFNPFDILIVVHNIYINDTLMDWLKHIPLHFGVTWRNR